jgi:hypothetical protein
LGNLCAAIVGRTQFSSNSPDEHQVASLGFWGLLFLEFPPYFISTVYTLVLLFWLKTCKELLPHRYGGRFETMKIVTIVYNGLCYVIFFASLILLILEAREHLIVYSVGAMLRDIVLAIVFLIFYFSLKIGLRKIGNFATIEIWLFRVAWVAAVLLLLRGVLPLTQGMLILDRENPQETECNAGFMIWWILSELLLEGLPVWYVVKNYSKFGGDSQAEGTDRRMGGGTIMESIMEEDG